MLLGVRCKDVRLKVSNKILQHLKLVNFNFFNIVDRTCHRFPNSKNDLHRLKSWINIIFGGVELSNVIAATYYINYVCDSHITSDCLSPGTNRLKKNVYPSLNLHQLQQCRGLCADYIIFICDLIVFCTLLFI